jgi:uncharacterized membrane protein YbhN (UPF0104 family)
MVAALLVVLLLRVPLGGPNIEWVRRGGYAMFFFFLGLLVFLVVAYVARDLALKLVRATAGRVSQKLSDKLCYLLESFVRGLRALPSAREIGVIVSLTAAYWGINALGMLILALGFGIHLSILQALTCLGVLVIGVMLPAGPGMVGTFQAFSQLGLSLFIDDQDRAAAFANVLWAGQFIQQVGLGLFFLNSKHLSSDHHRVTLGELMHAEEEVEEEGGGDGDGKGAGGQRSTPPASPESKGPPKQVRASLSRAG